MSTVGNWSATVQSSEALRIGILQTDQVMQRFRGRHGDYPGMFRDLLTDAADAEDAEDGEGGEDGEDGAVRAALEFDTIDARQQAYPAPGACDAYIITGSRHSVYDDLPWIAALAGFVERALDAGSKVVGICFGHQLIAHFFGGETGLASGWAVGVHQSRVVADAPWLTPKLQRFSLLSSHKDQVLRMPGGAELIASNPFCPIGGFTWGDGVLTLQGHPEFRKPYSLALMNMRRDLLGEDTYRAGIDSLQEDIHPQAVGRWMLNFCRGG